MSFQIITGTRRPRGLGVGPFISANMAVAGEAIGRSIRAGRMSTGMDATINRSETFTDDTGGTGGDLGPTETYTPLGADEIDCGCLAKRSLEAFVNTGDIDQAQAAEALADETSICEEDPETYYMASAGLFPNGEVPPCSWWEVPARRNKYLAIGAGVALLGGIGLMAMKRRRR